MIVVTARFLLEEHAPVAHESAAAAAATLHVPGLLAIELLQSAGDRRVITVVTRWSDDTALAGFRRAHPHATMPWVPSAAKCVDMTTQELMSTTLLPRRTNGLPREPDAARDVHELPRVERRLALALRALDASYQRIRRLEALLPTCTTCGGNKDSPEERTCARCEDDLREDDPMARSASS